jgi:hypothetical protein
MNRRSRNHHSVASFLVLLLAPGSGYRGDIRQSWMEETIMKAQGQYSAGFSATPLDSACTPAPVF